MVQDAVDFLSGTAFYGSYGPKVEVENRDLLNYYVRGGDSEMESLAALHWDDAVITKPVSVEWMHAWLKNHPDAFFAAMPKKTPKAKFEM